MLYDSLAELVRDRLWAHPDRVALGFEAGTWTYAQMFDRACRLGHLIGAQGRHLGVLADNLPDVVAALWACALTGSCAVMLSPDRYGDDLAGDIAATDVDTLLVEPRYAPLLEDATVDAFVAAGRLFVLDRQAEPGLVEPSESVEAALLVASGDDPDIAPSPDDPAVITFTSKRFRPVVRTHASLLDGARRAVEAAGWTQRDRIYGARPLCDLCAVESGPVAALTAGAMFVPGRRFDPSRFASDVTRHECTSFVYAGSMPARLHACGGVPSCLRSGLGSGAPAQVRERFGIGLVDVVECQETGAAPPVVEKDGWWFSPAAFDGYYRDELGSRAARREGLIALDVPVDANPFESEALAHPDVVEAAAYEVPAPSGQAETMLAVVLRPGVDFEPCFPSSAPWIRVVRPEIGLPATVTGRIDLRRLQVEKFLLDVFPDDVWRRTSAGYRRFAESEYVALLKDFAQRKAISLLRP